MKSRSLALLLVAASALPLVRAQDEERQRPPTEIPDFSNLDEYIYEPKSTVTLGFRHLSGAKTQFSGVGVIAAPLDTSGLGGHYYHDGDVRPDTRTAPLLDSSGNPMIDPNSGKVLNQPIAPDGKTNSWSFTNQSQVDNAPLGFIAFHTYSANVTDTAVHDASGRSSNGLDLAMTRDMGKLFGGRVPWDIVVGMSVNDISGKKLDKVAANVQTITDLYSLYGITAPAAPYTAPSSTSTTVTDAQGNSQVISVDNSVLISSDPVNAPGTGITTVASNTAVVDHWKVKGAYYTFRGGPELWLPIGSRFRAGVSAGAALVYSGTTYTVTQTFTPGDDSADITTQDTGFTSRLLPGYFADATVQFDLTDKAGFFAGAVFQSAGSYTQHLTSASANYATKIDLSNQNGFRAGMSVRF